MAEKPDIRIIIGANQVKSKSVIKEDLKNIIDKINSEKNTSRITLGLDYNKTKKQFESDLKNIIKNISIDGNIVVNPKQTKENSEKISKSFADAFNSGKIKNQIDIYEQQVERLSKSHVDLNPELNKVKVAFDSLNSSAQKNGGVLSTQDKNIKSLIDDFNKYNNELNQSIKLSSKTTSNKFASEKDLDNIQNLINSIQKYREQNDRVEGNNYLSGQLEEIESAAIKFKSSKIFDAADVKKLTYNFGLLKEQVHSCGQEGQKWSTKLSQQLQKLGVYFSAATVMMAVWKQLKDTISNVVELDKSITDLAIATGYDREKTKELLDTYSDLGQQMGATTADVADAANDWLRQGKSISETNELIKDSLMLAKLGQMDTADSTKALTSATKGYNLTAEEAIDVVDKFTSVDMKSATSAGYLATAMSETATSARLAGVDMNTLTGYIASVGEVTQDGAESVGKQNCQVA